ncbi:MAG: molybdenum cofactor guanylyltransferase [Myxococcota bacterium]
MSLRVGIFVGGRGARMGGAAKGLLELPSGERLLDRLVAETRAALPDANIVLVGAADAYSNARLPALADQPAGIGPLGGLAALLADANNAADAHKAGDAAAIALACDLPYVSRALITRLAHETPHALALAPRRGNVWEPLCARYAVAALPHVQAAIQANQRSLQRLFERLASDAHELPINETEARELFDWDTPEDMRAPRDI